jgi:hypothetical protein
MRSPNESDRTRAFELIIATHWRSIYKYIRRRWNRSSDDAKGLTLGFLSRIMQKGFFDRYDPGRTRFRAFLQAQVDSFVSIGHHPSSESALQPLDFSTAEEELAHDPLASNRSDVELFDSEWVRSLFTLAIEQLHSTLESQGKLLHFKLFQRFDLQDRSSEEPISLEHLAQEFSLSTTEAASCLADTRQSLNTIVLDLIRSFTSSNNEFRQEARSVFGL